MLHRLLLAVLFGSATGVSAFAWDGTDVQSGERVQVDREEPVRRGRDISIYDYADRSYKDVTVDRIRRSSGAVELEVYDWETGEYRVLEFDE